jgi:hypothetical protein
MRVSDGVRGKMKKVVSGGPANRTALREPCRPFRYNPILIGRSVILDNGKQLRMIAFR